MIEVALYQNVEVEAVDIDMASKGHQQSNFWKVLNRLAAEWQKLSPVIVSVAAGDPTSFENAAKLVNIDSVPQ
jgi:hypothetical protein